MAQETELPMSVSTLAQTEQALKRLDSLESNAQVSKYQEITVCQMALPQILYILYTRVFVGSVRR